MDTSTPQEQRESEVTTRMKVWAWSSTAPAVLVLCTVVLAFYHRLWMPDLVLIKRDAFRFFLPFKQYVIERLAAGELPEWFPYAALGHRLVGVGVFHPFTILYFLFPVHEAYRISTLLSCLVAALGAFALGRTFQYSRAGSLMAGVAFALSGYVVSLTDNLLYLYSVCALPIFCWSLERAIRNGRAWVAAPALIWATVFFNGDIQTGYYYGFVALLWFAMRSAGSYRESALRLILTVGLTALLAGAELAPSWATFAGSNRAQAEGFHQSALWWSTPPLRLLAIVASPTGQVGEDEDASNLLFSSEADEGFSGGLWAESVYLGLPVVGLAVLGAWRRRDLRVLAWLAGFSLLLSLGRSGVLYELFYAAIPFWSAFRYPEKLVGIASFALAMLAGAGVDALRRGEGGPTGWWVAAGFCLLAGIVLRAELVGGWVGRHAEIPEGLAVEAVASLGGAFLFSLATSLTVGFAAWGIKESLMRKEMLLLLVFAVVLVDLYRINQQAYHTAPAEVATFKPGFAEAITRHAGTEGPGHFRIFTFTEEERVSRMRLDRWLDSYGIDAMMERQALDLEYNAQFHIESTKVYLPYRTQEIDAFLEAWPRFGFEAGARYNVAYYIGRGTRFAPEHLQRNIVAYIADFDLALMRNPVPLTPRAYLSRHPERTAAPVDLLRLGMRPDFLKGEIDVVEAPEGVLPGPRRDKGTVVMERYAPEEIRIRVETPEDSVLILLDMYDAGWRATLDGEPVTIRRANGIARAVIVPAGVHKVEFTYATPLLQEGMVCSAIGLLGCLVFLGQALWRRPRMTVRGSRTDAPQQSPAWEPGALSKDVD